MIRLCTIVHAMSELNSLALRHLRERSGFTVRDIAEATGLSYSYVAMLERGERAPTFTTIQVLAKALNLPVGALLRSIPEEEAVS